MERSSASSMPAVGRTDSQSSYWRSSIYLKERRFCRYVLAVLFVMIVIGMIVGLVFVAHSYFHIWGGQGFLKARKQVLDFDGNGKPQSYLPIRSMARPIDGIRGFDCSGVKRSPSILPFYPCGDQQNSCEAHNRADICCPIGMSCHSTSYTNSGTFCCDSMASDPECQASQSRPPKCPSSNFECTAVVGGGCCSNGTACSENGCIEFDGSGTPQPITSTYTTMIVHTTASKAVGSSSDGQQAETGNDFIVTTITTTVTMILGGATTPTATIQKQGEEAQKAEGASLPKIGWPVLHIFYSPIGMLAFIALGMMFV